MVTLMQAHESFKDSILPMVIEQYGENDECAISEAWNDYTDGLTKDGELCSLQYHYCPSFEDSMPDNDLEFILESMGVTFTQQTISHRSGGIMSDMSRHFQCKISRNKNDISVQFSQGSAHTMPPELTDVLSCIIRDVQGYEPVFEDFANEYGYDVELREERKKAIKIWKAIAIQKNAIECMFSSDEIEQLIELSDLYGF